MDFILYEMLDQHLIFNASCLDAFANLKTYHDNFEKLEKIQAYMKSKGFISHPLNNKMAKFGNQ